MQEQQQQPMQQQQQSIQQPMQQPLQQQPMQQPPQELEQQLQQQQAIPGPHAAMQAQGALVPSNTPTVSAEQAMQKARQQTQRRLSDPDLHYPGEELKQGITVFLYGSVGTWKTSWAAQWPKPIFLSVGPEGGDDALAMMPSLYGLPAPPSYHITSKDMMQQKVEYLASNYQQMDINTVVIDSLTFYADLWVAELMERRYADPKVRQRMANRDMDGAMTMRDWGMLAMHIRYLAMVLHRTSMNVIWLALEKEVHEADAQGSSRIVSVDPYIRGETYIKLPGMCKMIIHAYKQLKPDPSVPGRHMIQPIFYTSPNWLTKIVRHKYGHAFPEGHLIDPQYGDLPTFNAVWSRIGNFVYVT